MDAKDCVIASFRKLLETTPYEKITVADICRNAHLSRKSFYAHFCDKEAIVKAIFDDDIIRPLENFNDLLSPKEAGNFSILIQEKIYSNIAVDKDYYWNLVRTLKGNNDTFLRVATRSIYSYNMKIFKELGMDLSPVECDYVSYFFASSQAMIVQKWICDGMIMTPRELAELYCRLTWPFWDGIHAKL